MRVLHINATSHRGGAARAMRRLHDALIEKGHESRFLVGRSIQPDDEGVHLIWDEVSHFTKLDTRIKSRIGNLLQKNIGLHPWSNQNNLRIPETDLYKWADIIDLRNLFGGYFNLWSLPALSAGKPVVWRMPDLWAITGHCAYPYDCERWMTGCYQCPLLTRSGRMKVEPPPPRFDGTRRMWRAKKQIYQRSNLHIIVTTNWMKDQVSRSILRDASSVNIISNGVDLEKFSPINQIEARQKLGLDPEKRILVWSAGGKGNYRKGYHLAYQALEEIQAQSDTAPLLITMGRDEGWKKEDTLKDVRHFGFVGDAKEQALIYSAADVFLCSTLADGQPQTALESLACGTPVIAFDVGPMPGFVFEGQTGVIVPQTTSAALVRVIQSDLIEKNKFNDLRLRCRRYAEKNFDLGIQTDKYVSLYQSILNDQIKGPVG